MHATRTSTGLALAALAGFTTQALAQEHEDFDTYATHSQVVGQGGWEEEMVGHGADVTSAQSWGLGQSLAIHRRARLAGSRATTAGGGSCAFGSTSRAIWTDGTS